MAWSHCSGNEDSILVPVKAYMMEIYRGLYRGEGGGLVEAMTTVATDDFFGLPFPSFI